MKNYKTKLKIFNYNFLSKNHRGLSVIIGYLLLVSFAIIISALVYSWAKTYVPTESLECPESISVYIKETNCSINGTDYILSLTLKNNGRFNIAGFYIYATNNSAQEIATINLQNYLTIGGTKFGNNILFGVGNSNSFKINDERETIFTLNESIYSLTIIPTRFNQIDGKSKYVRCTNGKIKEKVTCS